jgi:hypothetical protein
MIGKSTGGFRRLSRSEKAGNDGIDETPPSQGIGARATLATGRASRASQDTAVVQERKAGHWQVQ